MPDNNIEWGQGAVNNTNDWGKGKTNSANNWGKVYETSPAGDTNIIGGLALTITYSASAYCDGIGDTPQPTVAGNTGSGTFSSTTGLTINSSTGIIDVDASTKGATYLVTYTDTDSDTATANVTLNALDNAAFAYSASSYEPTDADPTPTITGLTGGTFSGTTGLVINSTTGEIDLSASTVASYTITYDTTLSGSSVCPNTSTQTVEIAVAGISNVYSMNFDSGSSDYIDVGTSLGNTLGSSVSDMSVSLWYKNTTGSNQGLLSIISSNSANNSDPFAISYNNNSVYVWFGSSNYNYYAQTNDTNWHHLAIVKNGTSLTVYIDGSSVSPTATVGSIPATINTTNKETFIGLYYNTNFTYNGSIDEVGIWNTALTSTQVQSIYDATSTNLTKDLTTVSGSNLIYWNRMGD